MTERDDATLRRTNSNLEILNPKQIRIAKNANDQDEGYPKHLEHEGEPPLLVWII